MAPKPKLDSGQRHCLSEAIKLLKPQSNAESAERKEDLEERINDWRHRGRPRREAKAEDARKELREMKKNARRIIKILDNLNPRARDVLPPSIRNITSATLREFAEEVIPTCIDQNP